MTAVARSRQAAATLHAKLCLWSPYQRTISLTAIRVGGQLITSKQEQAVQIARHWSAVFAPRYTDIESMRSAFERHALDLRATQMRPPTCRDARALLRRARVAAPGRDGLPVHAWRALPQGPAHLVRVAMALAGGLVPHYQYNWVVAWFPPKKELAADMPGQVYRSPSELRPLCGLDADVKLVSAMLIAPLRRLMPMHVAPEQRGFVPTRSLTTNIYDIDFAAHVASYVPLARPVMVFLDYHAAFASVCHRFLAEVWERAGLPLGLRRALLCLHHMVGACIPGADGEGQGHLPNLWVQRGINKAAPPVDGAGVHCHTSSFG